MVAHKRTGTGYFIYIRTSTLKQGTQGVSLEVQEREARDLAQRKGLVVRQVVSEMETAAKRGRPRFNWVIRQLKGGHAEGLILHKIDRGARNLRDWAGITDLLEHGVAVHIVHDSVDLHSRGGRLAGDMLAAVAADYIRNLREETKKGIRGRLQQGLWPFQAPMGYLDQGGGKPKIVDPATAPMVRQIYELYTSGQYSFDDLRALLFERGFRNRQGKRLSRSMLTQILRNPFYTGLLTIRSTGEVFQGVHEPIIAPSMFETAQKIIDGRMSRRPLTHDFVFRRDILCIKCSRRLIGELQKGAVYYRCHSSSCRGTSFAEREVLATMARDVQFLKEFFHAASDLVGLLASRLDEADRSSKRAKASLEARRSAIDARLSTLVDALVDQLIERDDFVRKKAELLAERGAVLERLKSAEDGCTPGAESARLYMDMTRQLPNWSAAGQRGLRAKCSNRRCRTSRHREKTLT